MLLSFVGALEINGRIPVSMGDAELLRSVNDANTPEERRRIARLELGPENPDIQSIHALLRGAYTAWALDVELLMDA